MKTKTMFSAVMASMLVAGTAYAMDSATLQERMQKIEQRSDTALEERKVEVLEQEVADLKALLEETLAALEAANM